MSAMWDLVTIDGDTEVLAAFWSAVLDLVESENEDDGRWIVLSERRELGGMRRLGLQRGTPGRGAIHLDLRCEPAEFAGELARLLRVGATQIGQTRTEPYGSIANLADPEGNLFDLCAYVTET